MILQAFYDLVCAIAHQLWLDGDTDPLGVRKIKAIALITALATGQAALDLSQCSAAAGTKASGKVKVYVRVDAEDLDVDAHGGAAYATGTGVERLGAATMAKLREWVGHHQVEILPVLNMTAATPSTNTTHPRGCRSSSGSATATASFPAARSTPADCDLDHEIPYDPDGPPGQTHPDGLACLCRRHHRVKTARVWRYSRTPEGHYLWHGPHGATYLVTETGSHRVQNGTS